MFARPLAKAGQISVGFFGKGSVSLREMGEARREIAEVRKGRLREAIHRLSTAYPPDEGFCKKIVRKS